MKVKERRLRGERGSPESEREPEGKEGRRGSGNGQEAFHRPGAIADDCTASLSGSLVEVR